MQRCCAACVFFFIASFTKYILKAKQTSIKYYKKWEILKAVARLCLLKFVSVLKAHTKGTLLFVFYTLVIIADVCKPHG